MTELSVLGRSGNDGTAGASIEDEVEAVIVLNEGVAAVAAEVAMRTCVRASFVMGQGKLTCGAGALPRFGRRDCAHCLKIISSTWRSEVGQGRSDR